MGIKQASAWSGNYHIATAFDCMLSGGRQSSPACVIACLYILLAGEAVPGHRPTGGEVVRRHIILREALIQSRIEDHR